MHTVHIIGRQAATIDTRLYARLGYERLWAQQCDVAADFRLQRTRARNITQSFCMIRILCSITTYVGTVVDMA